MIEPFFFYFKGNKADKIVGHSDVVLNDHLPNKHGVKTPEPIGSRLYDFDPAPCPPLVPLCVTCGSRTSTFHSYRLETWKFELITCNQGAAERI